MGGSREGREKKMKWREERVREKKRRKKAEDERRKRRDGAFPFGESLDFSSDHQFNNTFFSP
jgi:hypothetical protein